MPSKNRRSTFRISPAIVVVIVGTALLLSCGVIAAPGQANRHDEPDTSTAGLKQATQMLRDNPRLEEHGYLSAAEVRARHEYELEHSISFPVLVRGNPERHEIALTFDDGPHREFTPRLLDILKAEGVVATFFVVGRRVDENPGLVQREAAEGHEVANHTYHHLRLNSIPAKLVMTELNEGSRAIKRAIGSPTRIFRPPGGEYDAEVVKIVKALGYVMVLWTDDPGDYRSPGAEVIKMRTLVGASNGAIILLHDGIEQTLQILPDLCRTLKKDGFHFVSISEMAREHGVLKSGGPHV